MMRAYRSEWLKMWRPALILGGAGPMIGFAVLAIVLMLRRLDRGGPEGLTTAALSTTNGFALLMTITVTFVGVIALAISAVVVGQEYSYGTWRNLLVRQPHRLRLLAGKGLALATFIAIAAVLADGAALVAAALLAPGHGVNTTAWFSSAGTQSLLSNGGNMVLSTLAFGAMGAVLALVLRSTAASIAAGLAYALVAERLLVSVWPEGQTWLPGQVIDAVARGGTFAITYSSALLLLGLYLVIALAIAGALFRRRDIAA